MKIKLNKIPFVFKNVPFSHDVDIKNNIIAEEGSIIMVEAREHDGKNNVLDFVGGRLGKLWKWDKIPAVLGYRKAIVEFAGFVPSKVSVGDELYLLCESGVVGAISGVFEAWGRPMKVKVLGSIVDKSGLSLNLKNYKKVSGAYKHTKKIPLIVFLGTRMDCGKTTMACKIIHELAALGKKVAAVKLTGVAFSQDLHKMIDAGALDVYDFVDMGLSSTCNGNTGEIVNSALDLIDLAETNDPDCVMVEFGDGILGEYHVADILNEKKFLQKISAVVLAANDFTGIKGTLCILEELGIDIDLVTGPIANSKVGMELIHKYFKIPAESNQHEIPKIMGILGNLLSTDGK